MSEDEVDHLNASAYVRPAVSHSGAVDGVTKGRVTTFGGAAMLLAGGLAQMVGFTETAMSSAMIGLGLIGLGGLVAAVRGVPHLIRYGKRSAVVAMACLGGAGVACMVMAADLFESNFLQSRVLGPWSDAAKLAMVGFAVVGGLLMKQAIRGVPIPQQDTE